MTFTNPGHKYDVLAEIADERSRQDEKWGEQNHPDGTGPDSMFLGVPAIQIADYARRMCDQTHSEGKGTYLSILLEEVFEAAAEEEGSTSLRAELIQSAAVIVAWIEAMDRR